MMAQSIKPSSLPELNSLCCVDVVLAAGMRETIGRSCC